MSLKTIISSLDETIGMKKDRENFINYLGEAGFDIIEKKLQYQGNNLKILIEETERYWEVIILVKGEEGYLHKFKLDQLASASCQKNELEYELSHLKMGEKVESFL